MAKKAKPKPQTEATPRAFDEFVDDAEVLDEDLTVNPETVNPDELPAAHSKMRDWRDVERYREERELRRLVGDDYDELFNERPRRRR